jgi:hypothetical protein
MRFAEAMPVKIQVRVARDEKRHLAKVARKRGVTISELVRQAVQQVAAA